jgi:hypothetical protein
LFVLFVFFHRKPSLSLIPWPQPRATQVDPIGEHGQSFGRQAQFDFFGLPASRPGKRALLQPLEAGNTLLLDIALFI